MRRSDDWLAGFLLIALLGGGLWAWNRFWIKPNDKMIEEVSDCSIKKQNENPKLTPKAAWEKCREERAKVRGRTGLAGEPHP